MLPAPVALFPDISLLGIHHTSAVGCRFPDSLARPIVNSLKLPISIDKIFSRITDIVEVNLSRILSQNLLGLQHLRLPVGNPVVIDQPHLRLLELRCIRFQVDVARLSLLVIRDIIGSRTRVRLSLLRRSIQRNHIHIEHRIQHVDSFHLIRLHNLSLAVLYPNLIHRNRHFARYGPSRIRRLRHSIYKIIFHETKRTDTFIPAALSLALLPGFEILHRHRRRRIHLFPLLPRRQMPILRHHILSVGKPLRKGAALALGQIEFIQRTLQHHIQIVLLHTVIDHAAQLMDRKPVGFVTGNKCLLLHRILP